MLYSRKNIGVVGKMNKKEVEILEQLKSKRDDCEAIEGATFVMSSVLAVATGVAGLVGVTSANMAKVSRERIVDAVSESVEYQDAITNEDKLLVSALLNGEISISEYNARKSILHSDKYAIEFAKGSKDEKFVNMLNSYRSNTEIAEGALKRGLPTLVGFTATTSTAFAISEILRRKYEKKIDKEIEMGE